MFSLFSTLYGLNFYNDCDRVIVGRLMLRITTSKTQNNEEAVLFAIRVHAIVSWLGKQRRLAHAPGLPYGLSFAIHAQTSTAEVGRLNAIVKLIFFAIFVMHIPNAHHTKEALTMRHLLWWHRFKWGSKIQHKQLVIRRSSWA